MVPLPKEIMIVHPYVIAYTNCTLSFKIKVENAEKKCQKFLGKIERLNAKKKIWNKEMAVWHNRYCHHKDFSDDHPEVKKYFKMKSDLDQKMNRFKSKYCHHNEILKKYREKDSGLRGL